MNRLYLVSYGEVALKGGNRPFFLRRLVRNVEEALEGLGEVQVRERFGRILVHTGAAEEHVLSRLRRVFGVTSVSPAWAVPWDVEEIARAARSLVEEALTRDSPSTFKVDTRRADKRFPLTSMELNARIGAFLQEQFPHLRVRLEDPDLVISIEIREEAYLYSRRIPGPGGLPVGTSGRAVALISGGIDSPVAAWMAAKRGLEVIPVHFHSFPFTSERSKEKVLEICRVLSAWTGPLKVWIVYFTEIQRAIQLHAPEDLRVILMRRMMMRLAERIAHREGALAIVTGESLGQVASQTLESIAVIEEATGMPVFRPLIGFDKTEITARAREIGTYEISILPYEDCCSLFVPAHPRTRPELQEVVRREASLPIEGLLEEALQKSQIAFIHAPTKTPAR
ncbi:MAG: tRNA uracil 4-sulfurtransferase ThiI [Armatimonadota bacterium]|nr:tRNA uracil 4-sulfurtransferase ThiI [Armatimonadota bacterium]MDR5703791.1 tRNA uracil 4-sulfurtransferase ThiI [Armatimonadota bacterium]MDR7434941.1 tRNA uracil 4-sulfurtransferase ThiI [Armatimonadota bacterium]